MLSTHQTGTVSITEHVDLLRLDANRRLDPERRVALGQFMTPASVARLMASMLICDSSEVSLLDAGAGVGSLLGAAVEALCDRPHPPRAIKVTAYEIDPVLIDYLRDTLRLCATRCDQVSIAFTSEIISADFIAHTVDLLANPLFAPELPRYTCAILNPPYRKIHTDSSARRQLRRLGIETTNLYTGFLALALQLLAADGELVAITPRSFCNGPYFRPFRELLLDTMKLRQFHLFESRQEIFRDDTVLQENIILSAIKSTERPHFITITAGDGPNDEMPTVYEIPYDRVVYPNDSQVFFHLVPDQAGIQVAERAATFRATLSDLGLTVSTGRVVDFRAASFLRAQPMDDTVPLIYPMHLNGGGGVVWPKPASKKSNALVACDETRHLLVPNECYVLVKRFSSKEERRRVVATVYDPREIPAQSVGFENHLNYFHQSGRGIDVDLARGLAAFLNSTLVDTYFRQFSGHTQVNATDLRNMRYPALDQLCALGLRIGERALNQQELDDLIGQEFAAMDESSSPDPIRIRQRIDGGQNILIKQIIDDFAERFTPGGEVLYIGDTDEKFALFAKDRLWNLGVTIDTHGKMPDVIIYHTAKNWLVLIEAVTSHGPIDPKRRDELARLFHSATVGLVYVTAFLTRQALKEYLTTISWETEVWVADAPDHLIHFNGERFLGPHGA